MSWVTCDFPDQLLLDDYLLRRFAVSDAAAVVEAVTISLAELLPWMPWAQLEPQSVEQREQLIVEWEAEWDKKENFAYGVFLGGTLVASTGFHLRSDPGEIEIGYWVSTPHTRQGIATKVSALLTETAFGCADVDIVSISHDVANEKSGAVPARLGFRVAREHTRPAEAPGESGLIRVWSITRDEWSRR